MLTASDVAEASPAGGGVAARALTPAAVPPVVQSAVESAALGPQRKKDTLPVGVGGEDVPCPWTTARSVTAVPGRTAVPTVVPPLGVVVSEALQRANWPRTKSLRVAVVDVEDRVSAVKLEKHS
ncbi:hypothetical protein, partial [Terrabacter sp. Root181]|uniref:hypothetical protein n=1 Tax=Terrabacter sp. Root181 TaxID=1736484 RepID=UPI001F240216